MTKGEKITNVKWNKNDEVNHAWSQGELILFPLIAKGEVVGKLAFSKWLLSLCLLALTSTQLALRM